MPPGAEPKIREAIDIALTHQREGRLRAAGNIYRRVLRLDPNNAEALHFLGVIAHKVGRPDLAMELLARSVAADPQRVGFQVNLGSLYLKHQRVEEAIACYREAITLEPMSASAHAHLAGALARQGKLEEANDAFARATELKAIEQVIPAPSEAAAPVGSNSTTEALTELTPDTNVSTFSESGGVILPEPPAVLAEPIEFVIPVEPTADGRDGHADSALALQFAWALHFGPAHQIPSPIEGLIPTDDDGVEQTRTSDESVDQADPSPQRVAVFSSQGIPPLPEPAATILIQTAGMHAGFADGVELPAVVTESAAVTESANDRQINDGSSANPMASDPGSFAEPAQSLPAPNDDDELRAEEDVAELPDTAASHAEDIEESFELDDDAPLIDPLGSLGLTGELIDAPEAESPEPSADASDEEPLEPPLDVSGTESPGSSAQADSEPLIVSTRESVDVANDVSQRPIESPASETVPAGHGSSNPVPTADPNAVNAVAEAPHQAEPVALSTSETLKMDVRPGLLGEAHAEILGDRIASSGERGRTSAAPAIDRLADTLPMPGMPGARSSRRVPGLKGPAKGRPPSAESLRRRGVALIGSRRLDEAIHLLKRAVTLRPRFAEAHRDLGGAMLRKGDLEGAIDALRLALRLRPTFAEAWGSLGDAYQLEGKIAQAIRCYRRVLKIAPRAAKVHSNMLLSMNYEPRFSAQEIFVEHLSWAERHAEPLAGDIQPHANDRSPHRRLRIGYVSPDFRRHSVNYFAEPVLASHYRDEFHITCYSDVIRPDGVTRGLADMCDDFRDTHSMSDAQLAERIRSDHIDILVDLSGHTGNNRLGTFARKPAPIQLTYLGYPNTTGLATMDYRITDALADPPGDTERFHSEHLVRLPDTFLCYQPPQTSPQVGPLPCLKAGYVTFGSFNILAKITDEVMGLWARILQELPGSRLVLKGRSGALSNESRRQHVRDTFASHGIAPDRLELLGKEPSYATHLAHYRRLDIVLDPFPYNGTTTTCEALWMGLPVVTLAGDRHVSRVGVSILNNVGLPELIASSPDHYVQIATSLADSPKTLTRLRSTLRERMLCSPLTDSIRLTRALESEYRNMWMHWCRSERTVPMARDSVTLIG